MRHQLAFRKFHMSSAHRRSMLRNMVTSLFDQGSFQTTLEKAKELRRVAEKLITLGKEDSLHARRQAFSYLTDKAVVHKLFAELGPRYRERQGGYTRVLKLGNRRHGDAAELGIIELVRTAEEIEADNKKSTGAKAKSKASAEEKSEKVEESKVKPKKTSSAKGTEKTSEKKATVKESTKKAAKAEDKPKKKSATKKPAKKG